MSFDELVAIVKEYADEYNCSLTDSINDLEFDGPNGSFGPSAEDKQRLRDHFLTTA